MNKFLFMSLFCIIACNTSQKGKQNANENDDTSIAYANTITEKELKKHLYTYASDEFEGRETGTPGQKMAVNYIKKQYKHLKIPAAQKNRSYFQEVPLQIKGIPSGTIEIEVNNKKIPLVLGKDIISFSPTENSTFDIVYAGYGIDIEKYSDYSTIDVKDKYVLIKLGEPTNNGVYTITGTNKPSTWSNWRESLIKRLEIAAVKGATGVIFYNDEYYNRMLKKFEHYSTADISGQMTLKNHTESKKAPLFIIGKKTAERIYPEIEKNEHATTIDAKITLNIKNNIKEVDSENVIAYIKGKSKPNEYIVLSSHLDHIGTDKDGNVFNGADDDGSGTVALLEIAEAFKKAVDDGNGPERSIVFLHVTGEEKGLFGSEYYTNNPVFDLKKTVANLNIDMIGRIDRKREGNRNYLYLIGSDKLSTELHEISENVNKTYTQIELDYTYNADDDPNQFYYRSDHYHFAKNNVPVIFYFNGTHDDYHRITDTPDKINYDLLKNRTKLIFHTAWELANRPERIVVDKATPK